MNQVIVKTNNVEQFLKPIHLACGDDDMRPNMRLIEVCNGVAQATDGHILVKVDLEKTSLLDPDQINILNGKFIHMEVWKEIHKCDMIELTNDLITCTKNGIKKMFEYSQPQGTFFRLDDLIAQIMEAGSESKLMMAYNPKFIGIVAKIFQSDTMIFSFSVGSAGTVIFPNDFDGMFAILMPVMITGGTDRYVYLTDHKL